MLAGWRGLVGGARRRDLGESDPDIRAVGVAVRHRTGQLIAGLGISAPSTRMVTEEIPAIVEAAKGTARAIEDALATPTPPAGGGPAT